MSQRTILTLAAVGFAVAANSVFAQHQGDVIVGVTSSGTLSVDTNGFVPDVNYVALPVGGVFFPGWADSSPGFDHLVNAEPENDIYPLASGASICLEIVQVDPAFQVVVLGNPPQFLSQPGESTLLGDQSLHEHLTFHINADSLDYEVDQCVWHATFFLRDEGSTGYDDSMPLAFRFTNVPLEAADGDFNGDLTVDLEDYEAFAECLAGPNQTPSPNDPLLTTCEVDCINAFDFDGDLDVDLEDYAEIAIRFSE